MKHSGIYMKQLYMKHSGIYIKHSGIIIHETQTHAHVQHMHMEREHSGTWKELPVAQNQTLCSLCTMG